ncbi:MAG TPA: polyhydroxyalkanoate synthesis regulator DNA-binding domain-containing protein [Bellilinea sp.]|nr:polyhydroxyalkanoate synthesis regulator DNA-binding domain-containing protein [Bellilinea sp.]
MPTIKRYTNRKLYDVVARRYTTLEEIGQLVRSGEEVQVVDYATGADLTTTTLVQVLFDEQKRSSNFPPLALLTRLVNSGFRGWVNQKPDPGSEFEVELRRRVATLVNLERLCATDAEEILAKLLDPEILDTASPASATDVQSLHAELERLEKRLAEISASG